MTPSELQPGDLVFFSTLSRPFSHVGICKGNGRFVHPWSRRYRQMTLSDIGSIFWSRHFDGAHHIHTPTH